MFSVLSDIPSLLSPTEKEKLNGELGFPMDNSDFGSKISFNFECFGFFFGSHPNASESVFYLETRHPAILDGYIAIWTGLGGAGSLKNTPFWTGDPEKNSPI